MSENKVTLKGILDKIVFFNHENNFTIAHFIEEGDCEPTTVVGAIPSAVEGQHLVINGVVEYNPKFGLQIRIVDSREILPSSKIGIERFLGSGLIDGIGKEMAKRIVAKFGESTLEIIDKTPGRLKEISGIGEKRVKMILNGWKNHYKTRHTLIALSEFGIPQQLALKIYDKYKDDSLRIVKTDPYKLAYDLRGIGFQKADEIALQSGQLPNSPKRLEAAVYYFLNQDTDNGNVFSLLEKLSATISNRIHVPTEDVLETIDRMATENKIVLEREIENNPVYLNKMFLYENTVAEMVTDKSSEPVESPIDFETGLIDSLTKKLNIDIEDSLKKVFPVIFNNQLIVITGGPGTGKTTLVKLIISLLIKENQSFSLSAPTGRAAKRLHETTGQTATTLHRLLEYIPTTESFQRNTSFPLEADNIIVDEVSMVDIKMMYHLLSALKPGARIILVGDADQLPSVGAGSVLSDLIKLENIPKIFLKRIHRQSKNSDIIKNAHKINQGEHPSFTDNNSDFFFIEKDDPQEILKIIKKLVLDRIPTKFGFNPLTDIQVLSPMKKGVVGVDQLNIELQKLLNHSKETIIYGKNTFKLGDKVMQTKNNYDIDIFNGDIGFISYLNSDMGQLTINFYGREVPYEKSWLGQIAPAYAVSIHKSQGSEYPAVIIPLSEQHFILLQRNLLYTAVTRAKKLVCLVGSKTALNRCLYNNKSFKRNSLLTQQCKKNFNDRNF